MEHLRNIVTYLDGYLDVSGVSDYSWNGLQFEGADRVGRALFAVDAGIETFERTQEEKAQLVVVHHGVFWKSSDPRYVATQKKRLQILFENNISLYACHLPLDRHPTVGNNAGLVKLIGARLGEPFGRHEGQCIGYTGKLPGAVTRDSIVRKLSLALNTECTVLPFGRDRIRTVGVVSGGAGQSDFSEAVALGVDLYVTGEVTELYHAARDAGTNVVFAGHHATETVGVKALAGVVRKRFKVKCVFADIPTGL